MLSFICIFFCYHVRLKNVGANKGSFVVRLLFVSLVESHQY
jgi:hypothetical protein